MSFNTYHYCIVPKCKNTSIRTPGKLWMRVPTADNMRNTWLKLAKRDPKSLSKKAPIYFCEDHFDLENDMENYIQYKVMGSVKRIRMKPDCVPSKFECHADKKRKLKPSKPKMAVVKKQKTSHQEIKENLQDEVNKLPSTSCNQELMVVFEKVLEYGCRYCCVCLRMENEAGLIEPMAFKTYISTLNNKNIDFTEATRVCVICEEKAKSALRFLKAAHLAVSIQELYTDMFDMKSYRKEVQQHFNKINVKDHFKALDELEEQLMSWRSHTQLVLTDVLTVENIDNCDSSDTSQNVFYRPHVVQGGRTNENSNMWEKSKKVPEDGSIDSDCTISAEDGPVIILDDDEIVNVGIKKPRKGNDAPQSSKVKKPTKKAKRGRPKSKTNLKPGHLKVRKDLTNDAVNSGNDENEKSRSNTAKDEPDDSNNGGDNSQGPLIENPLLKQFLNGSNRTQMQLDVNNEVSSSQQDTTDISCPDDKHSVSFNPGQVAIAPNKMQNNCQERKIWPVRVTASGMPNIMDTTIQITEVVSLPAERRPLDVVIKVETEYEILQDDDGFGGPEEEPAKVAVPGQVKIDWEDKIPMDLISFMESNDKPLESNEIVPGSSVGGITDVRSITDIKQETEVPSAVDIC